MKRTIIKIDEDLCNGCGLCIEGCHEGALQLIDGKARMISDLYCDGLGACIPECPVRAITLEEREAEPYDEIKVMDRIAPKGEATVIAHLNHLIDHHQSEFVNQGIQYIKDHNLTIDLSKLKNQPSMEKHTSNGNTPHTKEEAQRTVHTTEKAPVAGHGHHHGHMAAHGHHAGQGQGQGHGHSHGGGCPGSRMMSFVPAASDAEPASERDPSLPFGTSLRSASAPTEQPSELRQWPVQLHLVNPQAPYFQNADVLLAADCAAFSMGNFHSKYLKGKGLAIACPKLDSGKDVYVDKLTAMVDNANINTLTVMMMEVPCCTQDCCKWPKWPSTKPPEKYPSRSWS
jgi:NAD-dependent dihydropyrimidine dehydrogenase PreA subunit